MLSRKVRCPDCDKTSRLPKSQYSEGRIIGDFILKRQLGAGSIGAVFFAHQISLDRAVALKVLSKEYSNTKGIEAFLKEARAAAKLSHPNLVQSFGVGEEEGTCFMAMNFIEGETVKDKLIREGKIKVDAALHIAQQVAEGLYYAWSEAKLIHRDVKPENIMLTKEGAVKLTDLGLAMAEAEWHEDMEISGSPSYMSPEQFTGEPLDTRSDVYSLGISLYQMLSGELPFRGETLKTVAKQHFYEASKPLHKIDPMIPTKVSLLVQKMIAKDPDKRFNNMEDLIRDIWEVRQQTAPDRDLVPSVHTISIKRLDYELQEITEQRKKHVAEGRKYEFHKSEILKKILFVGIPILIAVIMLFFIMDYVEQSANRATYEKVNSFSELMHNKSFDTHDLLMEWNAVYNSLQEPNSDYERELHTRMSLMKAEIRIRDLTQQVKYLKQEQLNIKSAAESNIENSSKQLQKLIDENRKTARLLKEKEAELAKKESQYAAKEQHLKKKMQQVVHTNTTMKHKLGKNTSELKDINEKFWKDDLRIKASYILVGKQKLDEAKAFLKVEEAKHPKYTKWFLRKYKEIDDLQKLYAALTFSGSKYAGIHIEEGKVVNILADKIIYEQPDGEQVSEPWTNIDPESLLRIAFKVFPDDSEDVVRSKVMLLIGKPIEAASYSKNKEIQAISDAVCEYKMDSIRRLLLVDRKKALENANLFIKTLASLPEKQADYRSQLKKLFSGDEQ
jgi:serine/threonine protein kinase